MTFKEKVVSICESCIVNGKIDWQKATIQLNNELSTRKGKSAWRSIYRRAKGTHDIQKAKGEYIIKKEFVETTPQKVEIETFEDGTQKSTVLIDISKHPHKNEKDILTLHGYDIAEMKLVKHRLNMWNVKSKKDGIEELYSSSITVKPTGLGFTSDFILDSMESVIQKYMNNKPKLEHCLKPIEDGYTLELGIYDPHFGKFAWHKETNADYDLKIAETMYRQVLDDLLAKAKIYPIKKIIIVFGNDFFNFDNMEKTTTGGTPQDTDTRLHKMYSKGLDMIFETIYKCLEIADEIEFDYVPSNHDKLMGYFASETVFRVFRNDDRFTGIRVEPKARKYVRIGNALICLTHGDKETKENLMTVMQVEEPKQWAETLVHEIHSGHFHSERVQEYNGILVRNFPSITPPDVWHYEKGWVGAIQKGSALIWSDDGSKIIIESLVKNNMKNILK